MLTTVADRVEDETKVVGAGADEVDANELEAGRTDTEADAVKVEVEDAGTETEDDVDVAETVTAEMLEPDTVDAGPIVAVVVMTA